LFDRMVQQIKVGVTRLDRTALGAVISLILVYAGLRATGSFPRAFSDYRALVLLSYVPAFLIAGAVIIATVRGRHMSSTLRQSLVQANFLTALSFVLISMAEAWLAGGYWAIPVWTLAIWLVLHLAISLGSAAITAAIIAVQTVIAMTGPHRLSSMGASNDAVMIGTVALAIPICLLLYLRRVERQREALEIASIRQSRFVAHVGHDLGQPLNATRLLAASLGATRLSTEQRAMVDAIEQSLDDTSGLFRSILDVSMLDSDSISIRNDRIGIGQLLSDLIAENEEAARKAGVSIHCVRSNYVIMSDRALLATVIQNLIANVIRHSPGCKALLGVRRRNGKLSIEVHDLGPGIAGEHLPRLFDEFYRGSPNALGAGLGLSIAQRLASILGADIRLASRFGRGTSASIDGLKLEHH
jgi:signal transduction histidine kinase